MPNLEPDIWTQRVSLNLNLYQVLVLHGDLLLALRHPEMRTKDDPRQTAEDLVAILSRMLVHLGGLTDAELRTCFEVEAEAGAMTWADFEAACARLDARVAAMGQRNPYEGGTA